MVTFWFAENKFFKNESANLKIARLVYLEILNYSIFPSSGDVI